MHLSLYQCKCRTVYNAHSTWQITLYQPPTVYNAHSTQQCLTVYIATKQAGLPVCRLSSCQTEPIIQTSCNQSANARPAYMATKTVYLISKLTVSKVRRKFLILVQRSLSCELHLICFDNWHLIAFHDGAQGWPSTPQWKLAWMISDRFSHFKLAPFEKIILLGIMCCVRMYW